jgi:hypothetical protein
MVCSEAQQSEIDWTRYTDRGVLVPCRSGLVMAKNPALSRAGPFIGLARTRHQEGSTRSP